MEWQIALTSDAWPRVLVAPTGSGKTAAVTLGWAAHRLRSPDTTPRRLVWCLPMRTLVEQTARVVEEWFRKLATMGTGRREPAAATGRRARAHGRRGRRRLAGVPGTPGGSRRHPGHAAAPWR